MPKILKSWFPHFIFPPFIYLFFPITFLMLYLSPLPFFSSFSSDSREGSVSTGQEDKVIYLLTGQGVIQPNQPAFPTPFCSWPSALHWQEEEGELSLPSDFLLYHCCFLPSCRLPNILGNYLPYFPQAKQGDCCHLLFRGEAIKREVIRTSLAVV